MATLPSSRIPATPWIAVYWLIMETLQVFHLTFEMSSCHSFRLIAPSCGNTGLFPLLVRTENITSLWVFFPGSHWLKKETINAGRFGESFLNHPEATVDYSGLRRGGRHSKNSFFNKAVCDQGRWGREANSSWALGDVLSPGQRAAWKEKDCRGPEHNIYKEEKGGPEAIRLILC